MIFDGKTWFTAKKNASAGNQHTLPCTDHAITRTGEDPFSLHRLGCGSLSRNAVSVAGRWVFTIISRSDEENHILNLENPVVLVYSI